MGADGHLAKPSDPSYHLPMSKHKSSVDEIRERFDKDVERFSNLETGQSATMDAALVLDIIQQSAARLCPHARSMLDIGCGAGNFTLKLLQLLPNLDCTLIDLSQPMLDRAVQRVSSATRGIVTSHQTDVRTYHPPADAFDIVAAAAVLHHLRTEAEWQQVFQTIYKALRPGGSFFVWDMIQHDTPGIEAVMQERFHNHLCNLKGAAYRDAVLAYIEKEDSATSLNFQMDVAKAVGFNRVEILHKTAVFAAYVAIK